MEIGKCSHCGAEIIETELAYSCCNMGSDYEFHDCIWKKALESKGGCILDALDAKALLNKQTIRVQLKSRRTGRFYYAYAYYDFDKHTIITYFK